MNQNLSELLLQNVKRYSANPALDGRDIVLTYGELYEKARPLIQYLKKEKVTQAAILMNRGLNGYVSIFACAVAGVTYMPILKTMEQSLLEYSFKLTGTTFVITEQDFLPELDVLMTGIRQSITCVICDQLSSSIVDNFLEEISNHPVYIMMTSGTTGKPKAVAVGQSQLMHYLNVMKEKLKPTASDRFSQLAELTFDLSVHDIFLCWSVGACLCPFLDRTYPELATFFEQKKVSMALMVPSIAIALERYKKIQFKYFQTIKSLLFCGEPLPTSIVKKIKDVLPNAYIENIYGPTEATVAFTGFVCQKNFPEQYDIVPIGKPFSGLMTSVVMNEKDCSVGEIGELWLSGPQVVPGYLNMPEATDKKFVIKNDRLWYKSGDLVTKDMDENLYFKGRIDDQWQVRGQRVERLDLEIQLRNLLKKADIALIPSPITAEGLVMGVALIFASDNETDYAYIRKTCQENCVSPFMPTAFISVPVLPLNSNGKVDYKALKQQYQRVE
jgi:amino acid adenylation domain-containing protein